jgi:hypothetical protein
MKSTGTSHAIKKEMMEEFVTVEAATTLVPLEHDRYFSIDDGW